MLPAATRNYVSSILTSDFKPLIRKNRGDGAGDVREGEIARSKVSTPIIPEAAPEALFTP